ncbi:MAG TPA: aminoglycoside phosphotransferase family protein [Propionibacterium sp.]|nr:aminoglycoside phosphotransferase family protein [Propionibacterium sp.]
MLQRVVDDVLVSKHPAGTIETELAARLAAASTDPIRRTYVPPLSSTPIAAPDGRLVTLAPAAEPLADDEPPPWREVGALLARLHACPVTDDLPEHGGRAQFTAAVAEADALHPGGSTDILRELGLHLLQSWPSPVRPSVVHGTFDLGRLGRLAGTEAWLLTGPHTLGVGDAAWDLAGPAALFGAGLLDGASWFAFVSGYRAAGGRTPGEGQEWPGLDHPARCALLMATVAELRRCPAYPEKPELTPTAGALLAACVKANGRRW